jgi:hypothetical protein
VPFNTLALGATAVTDIPVTDSVRLPTRKVLERYNICDRTLDRWIVDPELDFPKPIVINRRRYFELDKLEEFERRRAART